MSEFNAILESGFQEASARETFARQIEAKIKEINGAEHLLPPRRYGEPVSAAKIRANLTLRTLIETRSHSLLFILVLMLVSLTAALKSVKRVSF